jgi:hypothetical protein
MLREFNAKSCCDFRIQSRNSFMNRRLTILYVTGLLTFAIAWLPVRAYSQEDGSRFPYQAMVRSSEAAVHSGPGKVHYVTRQLSQGATVEVYRHDPGGWCAIRPPKGSFSLIPATAIEELGDGVGEITEDGTQAWVGTQLGPVEKPLWQVKMREGEQVQLLGIATWPDPEGFTTSWYQIAPPSGEFRWIQMENLNVPASIHAREHKPGSADSEPETKIHQADFQSDSPELESVDAASFQAQDDAQPRGPRRGGIPRPSNQGWRQARAPIEKRNSAPFESLPINSAASFNRPPDRLASNSPETRYDVGPVVNLGFTSGFSSQPGLTHAPLTPRMTELELKLNQEMVKEPNQWRLIDLQSAAEGVVASSTDSAEQLQVQRFLAKLDGCRRLRDQYIQRGGAQISLREQGDYGTAPSKVSLPVTNSADTSKEFSLNTLYDAHGWLKELVQDGGRVNPTFILQDENGKVTHHVSPGPGMNLSPYISKRIGIMGQRGYHTRLKLDHVTAQKIIELK